MRRPSELTRRNLIEAATTVFSEKGYEGGSVRLITRKAKANQAAITYHFGGKDGLYREVLRAMLDAFKEFELLDADTLAEVDRDEALRIFVRQQLVPLLKRDKLSRYLRILNREILQRTDVFQSLLAVERIPLLSVAERIVRSFLPASASSEEVMITTVWLVNQGFIFVRNYEYLSRPPLNIEVDESFVERLADTLSRLLRSGLSGAAAFRQGGVHRVFE